MVKVLRGVLMVNCLPVTSHQWFLYAFNLARVYSWLVRIVKVQYLLARVMRGDHVRFMVNSLAVTSFIMLE